MPDGHKQKRPLEGVSLGISISRSDDAPGLGFEDADVNAAVRRMAGAVIAQGGNVVFGHDWRSEGVMATVFTIALNYKDKTKEPLIRNFVPWPSKSSIGPQDRARYREVLQIIETEPDLPPEIASSPVKARVESLSDMRRRLAEASDARVCMGGRVLKSNGRCAGVVEEAALTVEAGKPLFLAGIFGGATRQIIDAVLGTEDRDETAFRTRADVAEVLGYDPQERYGIAPEMFSELGLGGLSQMNGLSQEENRQLFRASNLEEVIGFVLLGLGRMKS